MLIPAPALESLVSDIFAAAGCSDEEATRVARRLVVANLTGHDSHGVNRVPRYLGMLESGAVVADQTIEVVSRTDSYAVVDGRQGLGQTVGEQAVGLGVEMARRGGVAIVGLRNAGHLGRIGDWAEMAAEAGLVSIHFVNVRGSALVAPFGGKERRFGTNPIAIGVPAGADEGHDIILDFATSVVAEGKTNVATQGGPAVPFGSLITAEGELTDDPDALYGSVRPAASRNGSGALRAMGDHKGSGLAFMCEILAGALTGSGALGPGDQTFANAMLSIYVDPAAFGSGDGFATEVSDYVEWFRSTLPAQGHDRVLVPGDVERRKREARLANGVDLAEGTWNGLVQAAGELGVDVPAV